MNTPVEIIEMSFPVRVESYELRPDSGGAGRFRGGLGARRTWRILERDSRATVCCERTKSAPFGLEGGAAGAPARISVVEPDGAERLLNSKGSFDARAGSLVVFDVPGSGGFGPAAERDPAQLREDLADGYVTLAGARRDYGAKAPETLLTGEPSPRADRGSGSRRDRPRLRPPADQQALVNGKLFHRNEDSAACARPGWPPRSKCPGWERMHRRARPPHRPPRAARLMPVLHRLPLEPPAAAEVLQRGEPRIAEVWDALVSGEIDATRIGQPARAGSNARLSRRCLLPGSFNPIHEGHRRMRAAAEARLGAVAYELAIVNPDKPPLSPKEATARLARFTATEVVWLTRAPTFAQKARIFPGVTFAVGVDTIVRIVEPRYYGGPEGLATALSVLGECRFLVFGRRTGAGFETSNRSRSLKLS